MSRSDFHVSLKEWTPSLAPGRREFFFPRPLKQSRHSPAGTVSVTPIRKNSLPNSLPAGSFAAPSAGAARESR
jgi:hypothetical protein